MTATSGRYKRRGNGINIRARVAAGKSNTGNKNANSNANSNAEEASTKRKTSSRVFLELFVFVTGLVLVEILLRRRDIMLLIDELRGAGYQNVVVAVTAVTGNETEVVTDQKKIQFQKQMTTMNNMKQTTMTKKNCEGPHNQAKCNHNARIPQNE